MKAIETEIKGCFIIEPNVYGDERGYFYESYNKESFKNIVGEEVNFVQDNQSFSTKGVLRGLHYQVGEYAQAKLVRVIQGVVVDVAVDLRKGSPTFGKHVAVELSEENKKQLFVPRGFAHGFVVLSNTASFCYKCDNYYSKESEGGIIFNDKTLEIDWKLPSDQLIISEKDMMLPTLENARL
ncbi:dTDP-4-dehydrorhamnose 3,5-epimerase [Aquimarina sp. 2201CG14-23]|uniref:dTDP-4-dehydrorhamnose 3,5-epimerase n=1 Tax=Aquimarina mycalae TaxID=3040073 RepID=UPI002477DB75|nr:dTDP-4-dehydrorhamnose 3,5-epimerase [Aquimarina sp. 2201CG14-23]MDH7446360.1 dTDP-4-dehydrorhamnose 3,5-epimerase [Aquimarina sp. 2201CG14-23]